MSTKAIAKKSLWPFGIISVFILLALFDIYVVTKALKTNTGTVTENPYQESLIYEEKITHKNAATKAGLTFDAKYENSTLTSEISGLKETATMVLNLKLIRPDNPSLDRKLEIYSDNGSFKYELPGLKHGLWMIEANLSNTLDENENYFFEAKEFFN